jgi:hypothetical protein
MDREAHSGWKCQRQIPKYTAQMHRSHRTLPRSRSPFPQHNLARHIPLVCRGFPGSLSPVSSLAFIEPDASHAAHDGRVCCECLSLSHCSGVSFQTELELLAEIVELMQRAVGMDAENAELRLQLLESEKRHQSTATRRGSLNGVHLRVICIEYCLIVYFVMIFCHCSVLAHADHC